MKPIPILAGRGSGRRLALLLLAGLATGCAAQPGGRPADARSPLALAEAFVDAFYSFDAQRLRGALSAAPASVPAIVYYQGWAEGGNYRVVDRKPCRVDKPDEVVCDVTVKDDLIAALGTGYDVTDTFRISIEDGRIAGVRTSSNDPPEFDEALQWLRRERSEILDGPCIGFFAGGPTPQACVRAVVKGFAEFRARRPG